MNLDSYFTWDERAMNRLRRSRGITLVETIVAIGIVAVLIALLFPALNAARADARKVQCMNNQRQLCIATIQFHNTEHRLPYAGNLVELLPYLEQQPLYESLRGKGSPDVILMSPPIVLCPEDQPLDSYPWYVSYAMNDGGTIIPRSGVFGGDQIGRFEDAIDGLSATMLFSERLIVPTVDKILTSDPYAGQTHKRRVRWNCDLFFSADQESEYLGYVSSTTPVKFHNLQPLVLQGVCLYDHLAPPNRLAFTNGTDNEVGFGLDMTPSTSAHKSGVYSARCDGSVTFIADSIDSRTWRALGTVNRGDIAR